MEGIALEDGEINAPLIGENGDALDGMKIQEGWGNGEKNEDWGENEEWEEEEDYEVLKRRKLTPVDNYPPYAYNTSYSHIQNHDCFIPDYKNRQEWLMMMRERERKMRDNMRKDNFDDSTPKSGSETISDEHSSTFTNDNICTDGFSKPPLEDTSQGIIWPSWLDPAGKVSSSLNPIPQFIPFMQQKEKEKLKQRELPQVGDLLDPIDVTNLTSAKGILVGDGWRKRNGSRFPNIHWKFQTDSVQPLDPRIQKTK